MIDPTFWLSISLFTSTALYTPLPNANIIPSHQLSSNTERWSPDSFMEYFRDAWAEGQTTSHRSFRYRLVLVPHRGERCETTTMVAAKWVFIALWSNYDMHDFDASRLVVANLAFYRMRFFDSWGWFLVNRGVISIIRHLGREFTIEISVTYAEKHLNKLAESALATSHSDDYERNDG